MAFCGFDENAALFDATPVENMFITEYMLRAPGDFVKVYIYGLMLCYHPSERMSLLSMARDLDMGEEEVETALRYWEREGLVRRIGDNPVAYAYRNLKQMTLTRAEKPSEQLYNRHFMDEVRRTLDAQTVGDQDIQTILDWIEVYELPEEVVIMLLRSEREKSRNGRVSLKIADRTAKEWAQSGVRTLEDAEKMLILSGEREKELRRLLSRLGQRRMPSDDEKEMYRKWVDEWGFSPDAVQEACRETTKGTPTMAYLDGILLRQHQLGRHDVREMLSGIGSEKTARDFAREVFAGLGRTGITPTSDDLMAIDEWKKRGETEEMIMLAVKAAHRRRDGRTLEDVDRWLQKWKKQGLHTVQAVYDNAAQQHALNDQLHEIYNEVGLEKRANSPDRALLLKWTEEMKFVKEMIMLAAHYSKGSGSPMMTMNRILSDWYRMGITNLEAARDEHEKHVKIFGTQSAAGKQYSTFMRHDYSEEDYRSMVVDLDEEDG